MRLYTSLVHLKRTIEEGVEPPMVAVPADHPFIDASLTIGMGALFEDTEQGLRCPVRGCGRFFQNLTAHANRDHAAIGGALGLREALEIPQGFTLTSDALYKDQKARAQRTFASATTYFGRPKENPNQTQPGRNLVARRVHLTSRSKTGYRNLKDRCTAQIQAKLVALETRLGRPITTGDVDADPSLRGITSMVKKQFGSWVAAKEALGLKLSVRELTFRELYLHEKEKRAGKVSPAMQLAADEFQRHESNAA